jgi:TPR repeat protein
MGRTLCTMEKPWYQKLFGHESHAPMPSIKARAENGEADAQFSLGLILACRPGEERDYEQAAHWYTKAADQHHPLAQLNLGIMYAQGQGVIRDDARAGVWMRKSAEQGDAGAQFNLGIRCHRSSLDESETDAAESRIESYKWLHLAAAQGYREATASWEQVVLAMSHEIARVLDRPNGAFGLEYDNTRGEKNMMHLEALTYEGAVREAKSFLGISADNRDEENITWDIE